MPCCCPYCLLSLGNDPLLSLGKGEKGKVMFDSAHPLPADQSFPFFDTHFGVVFPPLLFFVCVIVLNTICKKEKKILSLCLVLVVSDGVWVFSRSFDDLVDAEKQTSHLCCASRVFF